MVVWKFEKLKGFVLLGGKASARVMPRDLHLSIWYNLG